MNSAMSVGPVTHITITPTRDGARIDLHERSHKVDHPYRHGETHIRCHTDGDNPAITLDIVTCHGAAVETFIIDSHRQPHDD